MELRLPHRTICEPAQVPHKQLVVTQNSITFLAQFSILAALCNNNAATVLMIWFLMILCHTRLLAKSIGRSHSERIDRVDQLK
jgi:hypothetical protein